MQNWTCTNRSHVELDLKLLKAPATEIPLQPQPWPPPCVLLRFAGGRPAMLWTRYNSGPYPDSAWFCSVSTEANPFISLLWLCVYMWLCSIQLADSFVAARRPVGVIGGSCRQFNLGRKVFLSTEASPETLRLVNETEVLHCVYSQLCLTVLTTFACRSRLRTRRCVNFTWRVRPWTAGWLDNAQ